MPLQTINSYTKTIQSSAAKTASFQTTFALPEGLMGGAFIIDATTVTGTSPTLDVAFQTSPNAGTDYYVCFRAVQITAAAKQRVPGVELQPALGFPPHRAVALVTMLRQHGADLGLEEFELLRGGRRRARDNHRTEEASRRKEGPPLHAISSRTTRPWTSVSR